jgi:tetrapyrrole methylase family protein/MazG family protein
MPALMQACKIQQKAARVGFDWDSIDGAWAKVVEEKAELLRAVENRDIGEVNEELGDLLFAIVNIARFLEVEPETALLSTVVKFRHRFSYIEEQAQAMGKELSDYTLSELDQWWEEAKKKGRSGTSSL